MDIVIAVGTTWLLYFWLGRLAREYPDPYDVPRLELYSIVTAMVVYALGVGGYILYLILETIQYFRS